MALAEKVHIKFGRRKSQRKNFLAVGAPHFTQREINAAVRTLRSGWVGRGRKTAEFEEKFKRLKAAPFAHAVSSCSAALHLSLLASGIGPGDEVITTPMTFCATLNAVIASGATPVLADINPITWNIDPVRVERKISPKTKAILVVHFGGRPCELDSLMEIAKKLNLKLIEDCAHALEAEYRGKAVGTFGDFGCFSFYATKSLTTVEGGMILAKKEEDWERVRLLSNQGMDQDVWNCFKGNTFKTYRVLSQGFKYSMTDLQASIGLPQIARLEPAWRRRKEIWEHYHRAFQVLPVGLPAAPDPDTKHAYHLFPIVLNRKEAGLSRDQFASSMKRRRIGVGIHYLSIPEHPYYQKTFHWKPEDCPHAEKAGRETVSLPLSAHLTKRDVREVIRAVSRILG